MEQMMGALNAEQKAWIEKMSSALKTKAPVEEGWSLDPTGGVAPGPIDVRKLMPSNEDLWQASFEVSQKIRKDMEKWITEMDPAELAKMTSTAFLVEARNRFPDMALNYGAKQLMQDVEDILKKHNLKGQKGLGDGSISAWEQVLAEYLTMLPSSVKIEHPNGSTIQVTKEGVAGSIKIPEGEAELNIAATQKGAELVLKHPNAVITFTQDGYNGFDPKLVAKFDGTIQGIKTRVELEANLEKLTAKIDAASASGDASAVATLKAEKENVELDIKAKLETEKAEFKAHLTATLKEVDLFVKAATKNGNAEAVAKVKADAKAVAAEFSGWVKTGDVKVAAHIASDLKKLAATIDIEVAKGGTVVTAEFEASLDEVEVAINALHKSGDTELAGKLSASTKKLKADLKVLHEKPSYKLAAEMNATLKEVSGSLKAGYKSKDVKAEAGIKASSTGKVTGTAQIDIMLGKTLGLTTGNAMLSFSAAISQKDYRFGLTFSIGKLPDPAAISGLISEAEKGVKDIYSMVEDPAIRAMDASGVEQEVAKRLKPVKSAVAKAAKEADVQKIAVGLGVSISGDMPKGGSFLPPVVSFGLQIAF